MHNRRKFLLQGTMATTAMIALNPLKTFASNVSRITGYNGYGKLSFLHTASSTRQNNPAVLQHLSGMQRENAIVLQAGQISGSTFPGAAMYDSCITEINNQPAITGGYKIISKGNIKTGVISANVEDADVLQKVNTLSTWLKKEKGCTVVVCLSQLGYHNKNTPDDISMAKNSSHLDLIIGGNTENFHQHPVILLNNNNEEVIIHSAATQAAGFGKIDIDFDPRGQKRQIHFAN